MKYVYFVSYSWTKQHTNGTAGSGNTDITTDRPIDRIEDIRTIEAAMNKMNGWLTNIQNFILLQTEEDS